MTGQGEVALLHPQPALTTSTYFSVIPLIGCRLRFCSRENRRGFLPWQTNRRTARYRVVWNWMFHTVCRGTVLCGRSVLSSHWGLTWLKYVHRYPSPSKHARNKSSAGMLCYVRKWWYPLQKGFIGGIILTMRIYLISWLWVCFISQYSHSVIFNIITFPKNMLNVTPKRDVLKYDYLKWHGRLGPVNGLIRTVQLTSVVLNCPETIQRYNCTVHDVQHTAQRVAISTWRQSHMDSLILQSQYHCFSLAGHPR